MGISKQNCTEEVIKTCLLKNNVLFHVLKIKFPPKIAIKIPSIDKIEILNTGFYGSIFSAIVLERFTKEVL